MEVPEIPAISSSTTESLNSPAHTSTPIAPTRKTRRADEKLRAETIAERKLTKLTAAKAKIAEDLATRNSERAANRKRLADAQQAADEEAADEAEVFDIVNEATEEREKSRLPPGSSKSKTKLIDIEGSPEANPKRRKGNDKDDKRPSTDNSDDEKESIAEEKTSRRKSSRKTKIHTLKDDESESGEEKDEEEEDETVDNLDDTEESESESESVNSNESQAKKRRGKTTGKVISTRKRIIVPPRHAAIPKSAASAKEPARARIPAALKAKPKAVPATSSSSKTKSKEELPIRKRKVESDDDDDEQSETSVLTDEKYPTQRTLINMNEVYLLTREKLEENGPVAVRAFHIQAHLPNFSTRWEQIIAKDCLVSLRFRINSKKDILGYTQEECSSWPVINGTTLTIRKISKDLTTCYSSATRTSNVSYDVNEMIRKYTFSYDYKNPAVEEKSISNFHKIIETYYPDGTDLTPAREVEICKAFYKKLSTSDAFGLKFGQMTKDALKGKKKDTILGMYMRLSDHLAQSRQIVNDAQELGNSEYAWTTPSEDQDAREHKRLKPAISSAPSQKVSFNHDEESPVAKSKPIAKRKPDTSEYPGMNRTTLLCHTCGKYGHNRYRCANHMNEHCNNTHLPWSKSPMGIEFKRYGFQTFAPYKTLGDVMTNLYQPNPPSEGFEYPTEEEDIDMAPVTLKPNPRLAQHGYHGKTKKPAYDDRRKSELSQNDTTLLPRIDLPRAYALLSAIHPDKISDYLQVHISLPQISMDPARKNVPRPIPPTVTATDSATSVKPRHAARRKTKTPPPAALANPTPLNRGMDALAQIDTGCQVGDVINRRVLEGLRGSHRLRDSDAPMWICSGLDSQCIESNTVLDIVVSFKKDSLKYTFSLPVRIAEDSEIDLILGIDTIKNLNLVNIIPNFFAHMDHT